MLGAGGPAGVNTVRALEAAGHDVWAEDAVFEHRVWFEKPVSLGDGDWLDALNSVIDMHAIDYVVPQPDVWVLRLAQHREQVNAATVLPATGAILICQDKFETAWRWAKAGLRATVYAGRGCLEDAFAEFGWPIWLRARHGAGAKASACVTYIDEARAWVDYWSHRCDPGLEFVAEEYLSGRDYAWCGVYDHGRLITSFARERLEYIYPNLAPSGRTGTPTIARVVHDERVNQAAEFAVEVIDRDWHGVACVDLREDTDGHPRPTEINAGRTCTTVPLYHERGLNVPELVASLIETRYSSSIWPIRDILTEGTTLHRHIDCGRVWTHAETREPALAR